MIKHFLIPSTLIILAAMSSCSPNDDKLNQKYTDQLAPGSLTNATLTWTSGAPGFDGAGGRILSITLGANEAIAYNIQLRQVNEDRYLYTAAGTSGFLNIDIGQLGYMLPDGERYYGQDFIGLQYNRVDPAAKTFFSRSFFGSNDYKITPFRINFLSFNGFQGYKAELLVPRGSVWAGQYQKIDQKTVTVPLDITFNF